MLSLLGIYAPKKNRIQQLEYDKSTEENSTEGVNKFNLVTIEGDFEEDSRKFCEKEIRRPYKQYSQKTSRDGIGYRYNQVHIPKINIIFIF